MGMNLNIKTETFAASENQEWLGSAHGTQEMDSITLDASECLKAFPSGVIPSGVKLGKITASGLYTVALDTYDADGAGAGAAAAVTDGSQTPVGHLFTKVDLTQGGKVAATASTVVDTPASLFWHGEVVTSKIPANENTYAVAAAAGAPHVRYV